MSEFETDTIKPSSLEIKTVNASRRKLTAAILAGPVVLSTLASKQALGQAFPYRCTVSGQISDTNSVRPVGQACNTFGQPPDYWKVRTGCWAPINPCAPFNSIFIGSTNSAQMGRLINATCEVGNPLEIAAVASYLNAYHFAPDYPVTQAQVVELFQTAPSGLDVLAYFQSLYGGLGPTLENCVVDQPSINCNAWDGRCNRGV